MSPADTARRSIRDDVTFAAKLFDTSPGRAGALMGVGFGSVEHKQAVIAEKIKCLADLPFFNVPIGGHNHDELLSSHISHKRRTATDCPAIGAL
jgi:hypothetical protein